MIAEDPGLWLHEGFASAAVRWAAHKGMKSHVPTSMSAREAGRQDTIVITLT